MNFLTEKGIESLNDEYFNERFVYYKEVIDEIRIMDNVNSILELGPYTAPLVEGEDVIDISDNYIKYYPIKIGKFVKHDCSVTPYPFKDKQYDLVIACQVLEHLGQNQKEVFKELCRISKKAIITLPYKWNVPCDIHHMIDEKTIDQWAQGFKPIFEKIMGTRILRIYNFDENITSIELNKKLQEHADFQILNRIDKQENKIKELETLVNNKNIMLDQTGKKIKELETLVNNKNIMLDQTGKKIKELETLVNNKDIMLQKLLNSNSMKMTRPLRNLRILFKSKHK